MKISLELKGFVRGLDPPMPTSSPRRAATGCHAVHPVAAVGTMSRLLIDRWDIVGLLRDLTVRAQHPGVIAFAEDGVASWDSGTVADKALRLARGLQDAGFGRGSRV